MGKHFKKSYHKCFSSSVIFFRSVLDIAVSFPFFRPRIFCSFENCKSSCISHFFEWGFNISTLIRRLRRHLPPQRGRLLRKSHACRFGFENANLFRCNSHFWYANYWRFLPHPSPAAPPSPSKGKAFKSPASNISCAINDDTLRFQLITKEICAKAFPFEGEGGAAGDG